MTFNEADHPREQGKFTAKQSALPQRRLHQYHDDRSLMDFPELCDRFPVGSTVVTEGQDLYIEVVGIDRNGYVKVAAPSYDKPGCARVMGSFEPSRVQTQDDLKANDPSGTCPKCNSFDDDLSARDGICESCFSEDTELTATKCRACGRDDWPLSGTEKCPDCVSVDVHNYRAHHDGRMKRREYAPRVSP